MRTWSRSRHKRCRRSRIISRWPSKRSRRCVARAQRRVDPRARTRLRQARVVIRKPQAALRQLRRN